MGLLLLAEEVLFRGPVLAVGIGLVTQVDINSLIAAVPVVALHSVLLLDLEHR